MKKRRVLHFEIDSHLGGIEKFLLNLFSVIDRDSIQFEFVTTATHPALEDQFLSLGGIIHHIPSIKHLTKYKTAIHELMIDDYDIIHVHKNSAANIIPVEEAYKCQKKIVVHSHNTAPSRGRISFILHKMNQCRLNDMSDYRIACSTEAGKWLFGEEKFTVLQNGIRLDNYTFNEQKRKQFRKSINVSDDSYVYGCIGRFTKQKNQIRLIEIFDEIHSMKSDSYLILVGDGELKEEVESFAEEKGLLENILFTGIRNDVEDIMMALDAIIMPSLYEGLPIVAVEAQATGLQLFLSENISKEVELCNTVQWFSLTESNSEIAKMVLSETRRPKNRSSYSKYLREKGFDISSSARFLSSLYRGEI